jgi:hypothetical protein
MKISLIVPQQIGALPATLDEIFDWNDTAGLAAFCTKDAGRVTWHGTSRTSSPQINPEGEISYDGVICSKARKQLEMCRLAAVQKAGTPNVKGVGRLGPLVRRRGSGGACRP